MAALHAQSPMLIPFDNDLFSPATIARVSKALKGTGKGGDEAADDVDVLEAPLTKPTAVTNCRGFRFGSEASIGSLDLRAVGSHKIYHRSKERG